MTESLTPDLFRRILDRAAPKRLAIDDRRVAAVLIPLLWIDGAVHLIFIRRTETVKHHRGQIAFPGGHREPEDTDHVETALREAEEEIGIHRGTVEVIGRLSDYLTRTSIHHLTPIVGIVHERPPHWILQEDEVAEVLEVPLAALMPPEAETTYHWKRGDREVTTPAFHWRDTVIWGATAEMLVDFLRLIRRGIG